MKLKLNISKLYYGIIIIITDEPSCCIERNTIVSEKKIIGYVLPAGYEPLTVETCEQRQYLFGYIGLEKIIWLFSYNNNKNEK